MNCQNCGSDHTIKTGKVKYEDEDHDGWDEVWKCLDCGSELIVEFNPQGQQTNFVESDE